jgi:FKBP-type peptidyl-prolyl cis-trans isomerase (trigger factor)
VLPVDLSPADDHVEPRLQVVHLPDLPEPPLATLTLERLTARDSAQEAAGLTRDALAAHLKRQVLDHLDQHHSFRLPGALVEREAAALWQKALVQGDATDSDRALVRQIAERRVRLAIVVRELARRHAITESPPEDALAAHLIPMARVHERPATSDDLRELDWLLS